MKYTLIELDKARNLYYNMRALSMIEDALNVSLSKLDFENMTIKELATILWAGLAHEDKSLTADTVLDLMEDLEDITEKIVTAFNLAFDSKKKKVAQVSGTGKN